MKGGRRREDGDRGIGKEEEGRKGRDEWKRGKRREGKEKYREGIRQEGDRGDWKRGGDRGTGRGTV